jgi:hypothetical protein
MLSWTILPASESLALALLAPLYWQPDCAKHAKPPYPPMLGVA